MKLRDILACFLVGVFVVALMYGVVAVVCYVFTQLLRLVQ